ncbi:transducin beta-like protein 2 [Histomonas meleagridis]|uniref:transducin beta-like protein 2 n=1 Tax=Histomonas meleagridis TaxID=135588 RepID=UPI0035597516|nr:transducin beta-like protein 2 [Histomonas meleagridis]KAH0800524.1 transducin beta-like protein 2 [Histomonas meleagridis]
MDILILIVTLILLGLGSFVLYSFFVKKPKPVEKEENKEIKQEKEKNQKPPKSQKQAKNIQQKKQRGTEILPTAEKVINLGNSTPSCLAFDPKLPYFIVPTQNRQILLYSNSVIEKGGSPTQRYQFKDDKIIDCSICNPDKKPQIVLALDRSRKVVSFYYDPKSSKLQNGDYNIENAGQLTVDKIAAAPDGSFVSVLSDETNIRLFHQNGSSLYGKNTSQMHNYEIGVSYNSEFVAVSSYTSEIVVYGVERDRSENPNKVLKAFTFSGHSNSINTIDFHPKSLLIASGSKDCKYNVWLAPDRWREGDIARLQWSGNVGEPISIIRINPVDNTLAIITESGKLLFCRKDEVVKTVETPHDHKVSLMRWSPDGKWVLVASLTSSFIYAYSNPQ